MDWTHKFHIKFLMHGTFSIQASDQAKSSSNTHQCKDKKLNETTVNSSPPGQMGVLLN